MTARLKKHLEFLKVLQKSKGKLRKNLLKDIDNDVLKCLCDCAHNTLCGNLPLSSVHFKQLKKHKNKLRVLASKKVSLKKKKHLVQSGGFISALLAPLLTVAATLLAESWKQ